MAAEREPRTEQQREADRAVLTVEAINDRFQDILTRALAREVLELVRWQEEMEERFDEVWRRVGDDALRLMELVRDVEETKRARERPSSVEIKVDTWNELARKLSDFRDAGGDPGTLATTLLYVIHDCISDRLTSPAPQTSPVEQGERTHAGRKLKEWLVPGVGGWNDYDDLGEATAFAENEARGVCLAFGVKYAEVPILRVTDVYWEGFVIDLVSREPEGQQEEEHVEGHGLARVDLHGVGVGGSAADSDREPKDSALDGASPTSSSAPESGQRTVNDFFDEARAELQRAQAMHTPMHGLHEGYAVLLEEVEELWDEIKMKKPDRANMLKEITQIAAMAGRIAYDCGLTPTPPARPADPQQEPRAAIALDPSLPNDAYPSPAREGPTNMSRSYELPAVQEERERLAKELSARTPAEEREWWEQHYSRVLSVFPSAQPHEDLAKQCESRARWVMDGPLSPGEIKDINLTLNHAAVALRAAHGEHQEPVAWRVEPAQNDPAIEDPPWFYGTLENAKFVAKVVPGRRVVPLYAAAPQYTEEK